MQENELNRFSSTLPINKYKYEIKNKLKNNQVLIITGETGCGKSTQVPKYLHEFGYTKDKIIVCLHPRCVAAMTLADRVSKELDCNNSYLVGYRIRFDNHYSKETKIMFMTTGLMLKLIMDDRRNNTKDNWIDKYSVIVIDEAHERSIQTDIMLGKMKLVLRNNSSIKLIIMSATICIDEIQSYYSGSSVVSITEKIDRVDVIYQPLKSQNYLAAIINIVTEIVNSESEGDILIFLQTEEKVRKCRDKLKDLKKIVILKFFGNMDYESKMKIFRNYSSRKVIVATNIAETSLTIPGINFVIDSGAVKRIHFNHETWMEMWITHYVSKAEADQRKGRTGRTDKGKCYRLYPEEFIVDEDNIKNHENCKSDNNITFPYYITNKYKEKVSKEKKCFAIYPEPELLRSNLGSLILTLKSMGIKDIMKFPFIIKPKPDHVKSIIEQLKNLSLLEEGNETLTKIGKQVSCLPLEPRLGKIAIVASKFACREDVLTIVAMLSVRNILKSTKKSFPRQHSFKHSSGDLFRLLLIYVEAEYMNFDKHWCKSKGINHSAIMYSTLVYQQLYKTVSWSKDRCSYSLEQYDDLIKGCFLSAFFQNIAIPDGRHHLTNVCGNVIIHPSSCLRDSNKIIFSNTIHTSLDNVQIFVRNCTLVKKGFLIDFIPGKFHIKRSLWEKNSKILKLTNNKH